MVCPFCQSESVWKQPDQFNVIGSTIFPITDESMCGGDNVFDVVQFKCGGCFKVFYVEDE